MNKVNQALTTCRRPPSKGALCILATKNLRIMKITAIYLLLTVCLHAGVDAHSQVVTINAKNEPLAKILTEIQRQTGVGFVYKWEVLPKIDIKEKVTDENSKAIIGATVSVRGGVKPTATDEDGEFLLLGVEDTDQLEQKVANSIIDKLEGFTNGLVFNKEPSTDQNQLRIRAESILFVYAESLIIVDSFPCDGGITEINPNDVERVTILKDVAAASIWGARAGNGVIVITTKRGRINQPLKLELNSNSTIGERPDLLYGVSNRQGAYPYMRIVNDNGNQLSMPIHHTVWEDTIANHDFLNWKYYPLQDYAYKERYYISRSGREDGSNIFGVKINPYDGAATVNRLHIYYTSL
jgi:TonB-dependent SusC/RagA subfamily outer membrane receptor